MDLRLAASVAILAILISGVAGAQPSSDGKGAAAALAVVRDICLPVLKGAKIEAVAKSTGLTDGRDGWVLPIAGKRHVEISPPDGANPHICAATVIHDPTAGPSILGVLRQWASSRSPPLQPRKTELAATGPLYHLTTSSWEGATDSGYLALVYSEDKTPDGKPVAGKLDQATLTVALTPAAS
jgi:hypothetical protein